MSAKRRPCRRWRKICCLSSERGCEALAPKLWDFIEQDLAAEIQRVSGSPYDHVINIGCAEGFYAIGLARRMHQATVLAFDVDEHAQSICSEADAIHGVGDRVRVGGLFESANLSG